MIKLYIISHILIDAIIRVWVTSEVFPPLKVRYSWEPIVWKGNHAPVDKYHAKYFTGFLCIPSGKPD